MLLSFADKLCGKQYTLDNASDLTCPGIEPQIARTNSDVVTNWANRPIYY